MLLVSVEVEQDLSAASEELAEDSLRRVGAEGED